MNLQTRQRKKSQVLIVLLKDDWSNLILQIGYLIIISSENIPSRNQAKLKQLDKTSLVKHNKTIIILERKSNEPLNEAKKKELGTNCNAKG